MPVLAGAGLIVIETRAPLCNPTPVQLIEWRSVCWYEVVNDLYLGCVYLDVRRRGGPCGVCPRPLGAAPAVTPGVWLGV